MGTIKRNASLEIPEAMKAKLENFQRRVWIIKVTEGLLAAACGLLLSYLAVFILDRFIDTSSMARAAILVTGSLGLGLWFPWVCHKWIWNNRKLVQVVRLLRFKFPRLSDHLLGIIELVNNEDESQRSEALCRAALNQVDQETRHKDFSGAVPYPRHLRWALLASVPAALAIAALLIVPAAGTNALARWLMPWKQVERYTFAQVQPLPEKIVVPMAEPTQFLAQLTPESPWSPNQGVATVNGTSSTAKQREGSFDFRIPPLKSDTSLNISIGDSRTKVAIEPHSRPELSSMAAKIALPNYLQRDKPLNKDVRGGVVSALIGSSVSLTAKATRTLSEATVNGHPQQIDGDAIMTHPVSVTNSTALDIRWLDTMGLTAKEPLQLKIRALDDEQPALLCKKLTKQRVMLQKDVLTFEVAGEDDYGVKTIGMEWNGVASESDLAAPIHGEKVVAAGNPSATEMDVVATFSPSREKIEPQVIQLKLFVEDYLPDRPRIYSPTYTLFVLSEEDHAIWLTRRLDQWFKQALETYEREQQLFQQNIALRDLDPSELDQSENRRKIAAQAAAEGAQQRRLAAVTKLGEGIALEATRNDQFNVTTLEKLSEMIQALDKIADQRMPSVADLLKKASDAPSGSTENGNAKAKPGDPSDAKSAKTPPNVSDNKRDEAGEKGQGEPSKLPSASLTESSMDQKEPGADEPTEKPSTPSSGGKFGLPSVNLKDNRPDDPKSCPPAQEGMQEAVDAQEDLLAEFQQVAEELKKILANLEGSTFVKRLKAMSRRQLDLAEDLNQSSLTSFGMGHGDVKPAARERSQLLALRETEHSTTLTHIQDDLEAFVNRLQQGKFRTVLSEMKSEDVIAQMRDVSEQIASNEPGSSITHAEFLADTFDRWAEQLVGPG